MQYREDHFLKFKPSGTDDLQNYLMSRSGQEERALFLKILNEGIHGFCYSLYEEGQGPGHVISADQIRRRMKILQPHTSWVRSFSCVEGNELIPEVAKEMGIKTMVGAWLGDDHEKNKIEIENLISLAKRGLVDVAAVGNEVLYRNEMSEDELIDYIEHVKKAIPDVPVGYVDAYYEFVSRPRLSQSCDVILTNCYPFWEGTSFDYSLQHVIQMYNQAMGAGGGKRVIITETGWPSAGAALGGSVPSFSNAIRYFINIHSWAKNEGVEVFHFSSFDESWKVGAEGDVGAHWGVWDKSGKLKF